MQKTVQQKHRTGSRKKDAPSGVPHLLHQHLAAVVLCDFFYPSWQVSLSFFVILVGIFSR